MRNPPTYDTKVSIVTSAMILLVVVIIDYIVHLGVAIGALYVCAMVFMIKEKQKHILLFAIATTALIIIFYFIGDPSHATYKVVANRMISIVAVWTTAFIAIQYKKKDDKLKENLRILNRQNKELEEFSFIASHDMLEPVRIIENMLTILELKQNEPLEKRTEILSHAKKSSSRLNLMVQGLLEYNRISRNTRLEKNDIHSIIKNINNEYTVTTISMNFNSLEIIGYKKELQILFKEIIDNSIKFQQKDIELKIDICHKENNDFHRFSIKDNGIGIVKELIDDSFRMFKTLHPRGKYEGIGIGLALCKKIIFLHEGDFELKSNENNGSEFIFTISKNLLIE
ncbi:MAG: sensor histidine kinase [Chitinophagales bacterium]